MGCDFRHPSYLLVASVAVIIPYIIIFVPESLDKQKRNSTNIFVGPKALLRGFKIFFSKGYPRRKLWLTLLTMIVSNMNTTGTIVIITLFLLHEPLAWKPSMIGLYLSTSELIHGLSLLLLLPIMVALAMPDAGIALVGIGISCVMDISLGLVANSWEMFLGEWSLSISRSCSCANSMVSHCVVRFVCLYELDR